MFKTESVEKKSVYYLLWMLIVLASLGMYAVALWFGALNQDEGWYLYSGRLASEGLHPFLDYASTQGPIMAYVYAFAQPLVNLWGVAGGRVFSSVLGVSTLLSAAVLAFRLSKVRFRAVATLLVFSLIGLNLYHVYFTSIVKTYSLAGLFVILGFLALERSLSILNKYRQTPNDSVSNEAMGGLTPYYPYLVFCLSFCAAGMFALASGVRLSAGILLPAVWLTLVWSWYRAGHRKVDTLILVGFLIGGSVVLLSIYVPFLILAPEAVKFGLLEYHSGRLVDSVFVLLAYKGGFVIRLVGSYFPIFILGIVCIWSSLSKPSSSDEVPVSSYGMIPCMLVGVLAVTIIHLLTSFPYDDYQVFIMPVVAVVAGVIVAPMLSKVKYGLWLIVVVIIAHSISSPMLQDWLLEERDRIWWPLRSETQLQQLQKVADLIVDYSGTSSDLSSTTLLTQDTYIAVECGMRVPAGMELGPFCYFPDMKRSKAEACNVLDHSRLIEVLIACEAPVAAFSGYGLSIRCPEISELSIDEQSELWKILETNYKSVASVDTFGQAGTTLRILKCLNKK